MQCWTRLCHPLPSLHIFTSKATFEIQTRTSLPELMLSHISHSLTPPLTPAMCISQESGPGYIDGNDVFCHETTDAPATFLKLILLASKAISP